MQKSLKAKVRRIIRNTYPDTSGTATPIKIVPGSQPPTRNGKRAHWIDRNGVVFMGLPRQFVRKTGNVIYRHSTLRILVGLRWVMMTIRNLRDGRIGS